MRRFVIGDIHGRFDALKDVLTKCKFDYDNDKLIVLGDIVDGGYNTYEVVEELLKIKNIIYIIGNHDHWFFMWNDGSLDTFTEDMWRNQGGMATLMSYKNEKMPKTHKEFMSKGILYHIEDDMIFVHGGFNHHQSLSEQGINTFVWDRQLINTAKEESIIRNDTDKLINKSIHWKKVFVGHTTTQGFGSDPKIENITQPIHFNNLIMMDTGAGWNGKLTVMDVDTEKFWQSKLQKPVTEFDYQTGKVHKLGD